ncbi:hypothetical protein D3C75_653070 [compost metagenome]
MTCLLFSPDFGVSTSAVSSLNITNVRINEMIMAKTTPIMAIIRLAVPGSLGSIIVKNSNIPNPPKVNSLRLYSP